MGGIKMFEWLAANIGTIIVALIVIAVIAFVVARMVKDKKEGKSSCGANCAHCACRGDCHNHR